MSSYHPIGSPFTELRTVDSTNNYAMGLIHAGMAQHGTAVFAHEQTKGRGQRQRTWLSNPGENIALSLVICPDFLAISELFLLSKCMAAGVQSWMDSITHGGIAIKWPNDIYWCDRKAGGILIENVLQGQEWKYAVAGIGINVNQSVFPGLEHRAVSLKQITGQSFNPVDLATSLCHHLEQFFQLLRSNPSSIIELYRTHLYKRNQQVKLKQGSRVFDATIVDVTNRGELVVRHATEESFDVGELEWIQS